MSSLTMNRQLRNLQECSFLRILTILSPVELYAVQTSFVQLSSCSSLLHAKVANTDSFVEVVNFTIHGEIASARFPCAELPVGGRNGRDRRPEPFSSEFVSSFFKRTKSKTFPFTGSDMAPSPPVISACMPKNSIKVTTPATINATKYRNMANP